MNIHTSAALPCLEGDAVFGFFSQFHHRELIFPKKRGKIKGEQNKHKKKKQSGWAGSGGVGGSTSVSCPFYIMQHKNPEKKLTQERDGNKNKKSSPSRSIRLSRQYSLTLRAFLFLLVALLMAHYSILSVSTEKYTRPTHRQAPVRFLFFFLRFGDITWHWSTVVLKEAPKPSSAVFWSENFSPLPAPRRVSTFFGVHIQDGFPIRILSLRAFHNLQRFPLMKINDSLGSALVFSRRFFFVCSI